MPPDQGLPALEMGALDLDDLPEDLRARLAADWARTAADEHASIASFSRFSLKLMGLGAPAHLLAGAHQAALDEVHHARLCFSLASAYAGEELGPGPMTLEGDLLGARSLAAVAAETVVEGCVGETIAAVCAAVAAEGCQQAAVREVLQVVERDEGRHAALAWQVVAWALEQGDVGVYQAVEAALRGALEALPEAPPADPLAEALKAHGRLSARARHGVTEQVLAEVLAPAADALLGPGWRG